MKRITKVSNLVKKTHFRGIKVPFLSDYPVGEKGRTVTVTLFTTPCETHNSTVGLDERRKKRDTSDGTSCPKYKINRIVVVFDLIWPIIHTTYLLVFLWFLWFGWKYEVRLPVCTFMGFKVDLTLVMRLWRMFIWVTLYSFLVKRHGPSTSVDFHSI